MKKEKETEKKELREGSGRILFKVKSDDPTQAALRRWLVMEIYCGRMSVQRAIEEFEFEYKSPTTAINDWKKLYEPTILLTLPQMTEKERERVAALEKHIKQIEKQLEAAQMKATALDMMIDIAESKLKISIRKKSGTKQ